MKGIQVSQTLALLSRSPPLPHFSLLLLSIHQVSSEQGFCVDTVQALGRRALPMALPPQSPSWVPQGPPLWPSSAVRSCDRPIWPWAWELTCGSRKLSACFGKRSCLHSQLRTPIPGHLGERRAALALLRWRLGCSRGGLSEKPLGKVRVPVCRAAHPPASKTHPGEPLLQDGFLPAFFQDEKRV